MRTDDITWLAERLKEGPLWLRQSYARALGRSRSEQAVEPLCALLDDRELGDAAAVALAQIGAPAVPALCHLLHEGREEARWRSAAALRRIGDARAAPALCRALHDPDWRTRRSAAGALARLGGEEAILPLCERLTDPVWRVRSAAVEALISVGDARATPALIDALRPYGTEISERAAVALGKFGDAYAVTPLCEAVRHGNQEAAWALGKVAGRHPVPEALPAIPLLRRWLLVLSLTNTPDVEATKQAIREVIRRIEESTAGLADLPLPAAPPSPAASLPVPAEPAPLPSEELPRPSSRLAHDPISPADPEGAIGAAGAEAERLPPDRSPGYQRVAGWCRWLVARAQARLRSRRVQAPGD